MTPQRLAEMTMSDRITAVCSMSDEELCKFATWYSTELNSPWTSIVTALAGRLVSAQSPVFREVRNNVREQMFPRHQR